MDKPMKKILLSSVALLGLTAGAVAADLPSRYAPAPVVAAVPVFTWTGFYVGAQAGYAWGEDSPRLYFNGENVTSALIGQDTDFDTDGFVGGVHAGYNVQFGSIVAGVEADIEAAGIEGDRTYTVLGTADTVSASSDINFQGSLRARLGVAFDRALIYATGGVAFANIENTYSAFGVSRSFDDMQWGWTIGAGVEYAITNNLTARAEYRYTQYDNFNTRTDFIAANASVQQEPEFHTVRVGVSYKFNTY
jgi:outer membrane immunogenic protein